MSVRDRCLQSLHIQIAVVMQIYWFSAGDGLLFSGKEISKQILEPAGARGRSPKVSQQQKLQLGACESIGNQMVTSEIRK